MRKLLAGCPNKSCEKIFEEGPHYLMQGDLVQLPDVPDGEAVIRISQAMVDEMVEARLAARRA